MNLIDSSEIHTKSWRGKVTEAEIRERLEREFLAAADLVDAKGQPLPGVSVQIHRGSGKAGGYNLVATRDLVAVRQIEGPK